MRITSTSNTLVIALWQNNHSHDNLAAFERDVGAILKAVGNISPPVAGEGAPYRVFQVEDPPKRIVVMMAHMIDTENANDISKQLVINWLNNQPGGSRGFDLGNGYQSRMNCTKITGIRSRREYSASFQDLEALLTKVPSARGELHREEESYVKKIVSYLCRRIKG
jgi:hypothetical protein